MLTHILTLSDRAVSLEITEKPDAIQLVQKSNKYGPTTPTDDKAIQVWLKSVLKKFIGDKRPMVLENQTLGKVAVIFPGGAAFEATFVKL